MSVHYKFKSNLNFDTVTFDGLHISVSDLKKTIMQQKKIGKNLGFDLQITNAQTKEVYDNDETLVPKNTSVIVARIPTATGNKKNWDKPELPLPIDDDQFGSIRFDKVVKNADIANTNATEDDKVKAMITQSSQEYDPSKYVKSRSMTGPLPPTYTCYRCGKQGHWIKNCPTNNLDIKRSTGIPRSFMVTVDGPEHKGALLTSSGDYAVPLIDHQAYKEVKKEKPPFIFEHEPVPEPEPQIPRELLCMFCNNLLQDAVLIPCCGNSFCDDCVRQALLDSDEHECPICHETDVSPDTVIPNRFLRTAVMNFRNESGYTRVKKLFVVSSPDKAVLNSPQPSPDSTVENHPVEATDVPIDLAEEPKKETIKDEPQSPKVNIDVLADIQPGTPLADEHQDEDSLSDHLHIETVGKESYGRYRQSREHYDGNSRDGNEVSQISTIETITNTRQFRFGGRPPFMPSDRPYYPPPGGSRYHDRQKEFDSRDRPDYGGRYDRPMHRDHHRGSRPHPRYDRPGGDSRYHRSENRRDYSDYRPDHEVVREPHYPNIEPHIRLPRYNSTPPPFQAVPLLRPQTPQELEVSSYVPQEPVIPPPAPLLPTSQSFPVQPPPPGASPIDSLSMAPEPPPPGVGPLLPPPPVSSSMNTFSQQTFQAKEEKPKTDERSIDDKMEAFQRELLKKKDREKFARDRSPRSSSRSRSPSRSLSKSRSPHSRSSYGSSKSWSRSSSRSRFRSSRSKSRSPYTSHSRSRSYSRSASRSVSKVRSYTRSRSRSRSRENRRIRTPERFPPSYSRNHSSASHSPSPRHYRPRTVRRQSPYPVRRHYTAPPYSAPPYQEPYPVPSAHIPISGIRGPSYHPPASVPPTHHHHQEPPMPVPVHHYPEERQRYRYNEPYPSYGGPYHHEPKGYGHPRYESATRNPPYESTSYHRGYPRRGPMDDVQQHRIPGWVGERPRENPRYRISRDQQRKEIKELTKVPEMETRMSEERKDTTPDTKEEKLSSKHKKHHHRRSKETRKHEKDAKMPTVVGVERESDFDVPSNLISIEVVSDHDMETQKVSSECKHEKTKEKKHKHKKYKVSGEVGGKKKKVSKKVKAEGGPGEGSPVKAKSKKKKKVKAVGENGEKKKKSVKRQKQLESTLKVVSEETNEPSEKSAIPSSPSHLSPPRNDNLIRVPMSSADEGALSAEESSKVVEFQMVSEAEEVVEGLESASEQEKMEDDAEPLEHSSPPRPCSDIDEGHDEAIEITEEIESEVPPEDELRVEVPELSKWEREESEEEISRQHRQHPTVDIKEEKECLSSDILQRAENAIMQKPLKTAIVVTSTKDKSAHKNDKKSSLVKSDRSVDSPAPENAKPKEVPAKNSSTDAECSPSSLQVTITADKEKRSVRTKSVDEETKPKNDAQQSSKRIKLDRSNFAGYKSAAETGTSKRIVVVEETHQQSSSSRKLDSKFSKAEDPRYDKIRSRDRNSRDHSEEKFRGSDRHRDRSGSRSKSKKIVSSIARRPKSDVEVRSHFPDRGRREVSYNSRSSTREERHVELRESRRYHGIARSAVEVVVRSRSPEYDSYADRKRHVSKRDDTRVQSSTTRRDDSSPNRRISPVRHKKQDDKRSESRSKEVAMKRNKSVTKHATLYDESKFEPDYDALSDNDRKQKTFQTEIQADKEHSKTDPEATGLVGKRKRKAVEKSSTSESSSSSSSESESSDSEVKHKKSKSSEAEHKLKHKKGKHKKHKKHKHKHKKKKSHKS